MQLMCQWNSRLRACFRRSSKLFEELAAAPIAGTHGEGGLECLHSALALSQASQRLSQVEVCFGEKVSEADSDQCLVRCLAGAILRQKHTSQAVVRSGAITIDLDCFLKTSLSLFPAPQAKISPS